MFVYVDSKNDRKNQIHMWKCILRPKNKTDRKELPLLRLRWKCACSWWEANKIEITRKWWKYYHKTYTYIYIDMRRIICLLPFTFVRINKAFIFSLFWNLFDLNVRSLCTHMWMGRRDLATLSGNINGNY